jgi:hypothetical protein
VCRDGVNWLIFPVVDRKNEKQDEFCIMRITRRSIEKFEYRSPSSVDVILVNRWASSSARKITRKIGSHVELLIVGPGGVGESGRSLST